MKILYSICVPKLLYACEVKDLTNNEMLKLNTAVNDAIRKIFSFSRRESTREIRMRYGHDSISEIFIDAVIGSYEMYQGYVTIPWTVFW